MLICNHQKRRYLNKQKPTLYLANSEISTLETDRFLGVMIDQSLVMDEHVNHICSKLSKLLGLLWRIRNCLDYKSKILFYNSYVQPHLDYCSTVWGTCSKVHVNKFSRLQIRIGRIILENYDRGAQEIIKQLKWMTVQERLD